MLRRRLRRAEKGVAKASRKVSKTVASSAVGESAKQLSEARPITGNESLAALSANALWPFSQR